MRTTNRRYCELENDFKSIADFLIRENEYLRSYLTWNLARFVDWRYGLYKPRTAIANFWEKNAQLWFDGFGKLAGFAISEQGDAGFMIVTAPGYRFLFEEIVVWTLQNWKGRGSQYSMELTKRQEYEARILERYGFTKTSDFFVRYFDVSMELPEKKVLEDGYTIIHMNSDEDYKMQRILRAEAFEGIVDISEEELKHQLEFYNHTHHSPIYHAYTNLCVRHRDGRHVSGCEALIDAWNCEADIERICTHSQFRKMGFARALIIECLHRLKEMGIKRAFITGYSPEAIALYGSLGAVEELKCHMYQNSQGG